MVGSKMAIASLNSQIDSYAPKDIPTLLTKFRVWHVESLLNQAVDLLDRCLSERRDMQAMDAKRVEGELKLAVNLAEATLIRSRIDRAWYDVSLETYRLNKDKTLKSWKDALDNADAQAILWDNEEPGPSFEKNVAQLSVRATQQRAWYEIEEKRLRFEADEKDRGPMLKSLEALIANAEALKEASTPGGALYYSEQIESLRQRILDDFQDAYDRLSVASIGLKQFYGYEQMLPSGQDDHALGAISISLLDRTTLWARAAVRWMVATLQYEHVISRSISVRALTTQQGWEDGLDSIKSSGRGSFSFWLDASIVSACRYLRFRGISGFSIGSSEIWSAEITFPSKGVSIQMRNGNEVRASLDQGEIPRCILGRIEARNSPREPELAGTNSLRNISPFGFENDSDGRILVEMVWPFGTIPKGLTLPEDFQFDLLLAGIPK